MPILRDALLLRIFISEDDTFQGRPLHQVIVETARELNISGATVLRGSTGFGNSKRLRTSKRLRMEDLPVTIEIVEEEENVRRMLRALEEVMTGGLTTLERVQVLQNMKA